MGATCKRECYAVGRSRRVVEDRERAVSVRGEELVGVRRPVQSNRRARRGVRAQSGEIEHVEDNDT